MMTEYELMIRNWMLRAREIHLNEEKLQMESIELCGELHKWRAKAALRLSTEKFAELIGLSANQYWKRCQVARCFRFVPELKAMLLRGETNLTNVGLVAARLTKANEHIILPGIKGKTKREVEYLLSTVTKHGRIIEKEPEVELRLKFTKSHMALLDRAKEVLSACGQVPTQEDVIVQALKVFLEKRDPMEKAKRAEKRIQRQGLDEGTEVPSPAKGGGTIAEEVAFGAVESLRQGRPAVPVAIRHEVYLRDGGQCTYSYGDGGRCTERAMLEFDHIKLWCRDGDHSAQNLRLRCREHNQMTAREELGDRYFGPQTVARRWRQEAGHAPTG